ncbi:hypothetical protein [Andreprevotia chitinilytica]|uniref:hypothetical protein n=1 Tax=Andreprevotia chitinilytica TaxID=396808 RepID=UPI0005543E32|nr:hypothetical protein [Andreprevotia chitinilytica]
MKKLYLMLLMSVLASVVQADDTVVISDVSKLKWLGSTNGLIYLRNLSDFDPSFLPCCYNYYVDTSTPAGKVTWTAILMKMGTAQSINLSVSNKSQAGPIVSFGNW